jgi:hypothetical protein
VHPGANPFRLRPCTGMMSRKPDREEDPGTKADEKMTNAPVMSSWGVLCMLVGLILHLAGWVLTGCLVPMRRPDLPPMQGRVLNIIFFPRALTPEGKKVWKWAVSCFILSFILIAILFAITPSRIPVPGL